MKLRRNDRFSWRNRRGFRAAIGLCIPAALVTGAIWGCAAYAPAFNADFLGVTTGGAQDIARARVMIESGDVPPPEYIPVEGSLSEHSIPLPPSDEAGALYAAGAVSWNRDFDELTPLVTVQLGFGTNIDHETFVREPLNLCLVIDKSGSMADVIDERTRASKWEAVRIALDRLLAHLTPADRVSIVSFDRDAVTRLRAAAGNDIAAIKTALDDIQPGGSTNLLQGIIRAYNVVNDQSHSERSDRLILFTDALPTAGELDRDEFVRIMRTWGRAGIGATVFGVGVDFGQRLAHDISQVRGGNYFFLSDYQRIVSVFDEEFDFLVTPVAHDVEMQVSVPFEFDVVDVYGVPFDDPTGHALTIDVPTLFLSTREGGGAILVRLRAGALVDFELDNTVASVQLSYETASGEAEENSLTLRMPAGLDPGGEPYFETDGSKRAVVLLNTALVLQAACEDARRSYYWYDPEPEDLDRAAARLSEFLPYFDALTAGLDDRASENSRSLTQERALVARLLANVESARPN